MRLRICRTNCKVVGSLGPGLLAIFFLPEEENKTRTPPPRPPEEGKGSSHHGAHPFLRQSLSGGWVALPADWALLPALRPRPRPGNVTRS